MLSRDESMQCLGMIFTNYRDPSNVDYLNSLRYNIVPSNVHKDFTDWFDHFGVEKLTTLLPPTWMKLVKLVSEGEVKNLCLSHVVGKSSTLSFVILSSAGITISITKKNDKYPSIFAMRDQLYSEAYAIIQALMTQCEPMFLHCLTRVRELDLVRDVVIYITGGSYEAIYRLLQITPGGETWIEKSYRIPSPSTLSGRGVFIGALATEIRTQIPTTGGFLISTSVSRISDKEFMVNGKSVIIDKAYGYDKYAFILQNYAAGSWPKAESQSESGSRSAKPLSINPAPAPNMGPLPPLPLPDFYPIPRSAPKTLQAPTQNLLILDQDPDEEDITDVLCFFNATSDDTVGIYALPDLDLTKVNIRKDPAGYSRLYNRRGFSPQLKLETIFQFKTNLDAGMWYVAANELGKKFDSQTRYMVISNPEYPELHQAALKMIKALW